MPTKATLEASSRMKTGRAPGSSDFGGQSESSWRGHFPELLKESGPLGSGGALFTYPRRRKLFESGGCAMPPPARSAGNQPKWGIHLML